VDEVTPVFVCGMGRSGTTNALKILNTHPAVALNSEIPLSVLKHFFTLLDGIDRSYSAGDAVADGWRARKADYIFESFGYLSKSGRGRLNKMADARFRGHKSPRLESLFDNYEAHFDGLGPKPRYFYCARNPFDCWRSYREMAWSNFASVEQFLQQYTGSFARLKEMQAAAADRVTVLHLQALTAAPDLMAWYRENIFAPLGLNLPERSASRIAKIEGESEHASNPALSAEDRKVIENYPGIADIVGTHFPESISASR
jgi:hypothetical protein